MKNSGLSFTHFEFYFHLYIQQTEARRIPFEPDWKALREDLGIEEQGLKRSLKILESSGLVKTSPVGLRVKACESIMRFKDLIAGKVTAEPPPDLQLQTQVVSLPKRKRRTTKMNDDEQHIFRSLIANYNEAWELRYKKSPPKTLSPQQLGSLKSIARKLCEACGPTDDKTAVSARYVWMYFLKNERFFSGHPISKMCMEDVYVELWANMPGTLKELRRVLPKGASDMDVDFFASRMRIHK